ncbi:PSME3-interacting protein isoform X2 [Prorops nasuta]|uniref:PSME3-interacting protein isoform X2 n=1 Tax=Prorops nasuta TaxID=863751 RepID=UPI0034CFDFAA
MSSGFISEAEIAEQRRIRQEEWEKVRTADQPLDVPEEAYDTRSLYERLQEQKNKNDAEYEEAHKLKNMIKGLDDDEVDFLDLVDRTKLEEERKKNLEEEKEMRDFKAAVASLQEKSLDERLKQELKKPQTTSKAIGSGSIKNSQLKLLAGVVVKKPEKGNLKGNESRGTKRKQSSLDDSANKDFAEEEKSENLNKSIAENSACEPDDTVKTRIIDSSYNSQTGALKCIGILPGLCSYDDSSDSDCSSDTDQDPDLNAIKYDLLGRQIIKVVKDKEKS